MSEVIALILAAGYSRRLGRSKKDLRLYTGQTLLEHAIAIAKAAGLDVAVTLPPKSDLADSRLNAVSPIVVQDPSEGMAASLRTGIARLRGISTLQGVLVMLLDQWRLTPADLSSLITAWETSSRQIAAARYAQTVGVPALFGRQHFDLLASASGDTGAREFLRSGNPLIATVDLPHGETDIDSLADLSAL